MSRITCRLLYRCASLVILAVLAGWPRTPSEPAQAVDAGPVGNATVAELTWSAQFGGRADALALAGDHAYVLVGSRLEVVRVAPPAPLETLGRTGFLAEQLLDVAAVVGYAFVAAGGDGLIVVDTSDHMSPRPVAHLRPEVAGDVASIVTVEGDVAWVSLGESRHWLVDIADPVQPKVRLRYALPDLEIGEPDDVALASGRVWLCSSWQGLVIVDLRVRDTPRVAAYRPDLPCVAVAVQNGFAYVATDAGLRVLDATDPAAAREVGSALDGQTRGVAVDGRIAYVLAEAGRLWTLDVSNPAAPQPLRVETASSAEPYGRGVRAVVALGGRLVTLGDDSTVRARPADARSGLKITGSTMPAHQLSHLAIDGDFGLAVDQYRLRTLDLSRPEAPRHGGFLPMGQAAETIWLKRPLAVAGHFQGGLFLLDVSNPALPRQLGRLPADWHVTDVAFGEGYLFVAAYEAGLRVVDIHDPNKPVEVTSATRAGTVVNVELAAGYLHTAFHDAVVAWDVSDPGRPREVSRYGDLGGTNWRTVAVDGHHAVTTDGNGGAWLYDVTDPHAPLLIADLTETLTNLLQGWQIAKISLTWPRLVVAGDGVAGVAVVNLSNPMLPLEVGVYHASLDEWTLAVGRDYAYLGERPSGLHIVPLTPLPGTTILAGYLDGPWHATRVVLSNGFAYAATDDAGLRIVDVRDPARPVMVGGMLPGDLVQGLALSGTTLYLAAVDKGLLMVDLSVPGVAGVPRTVDAWPPQWNALGVVVDAGRATVWGTGRDGEGANIGHSLAVLDIADAAHPKLLGELEVGDWPVAVAMADGMAYVVTEAGHLVVVDESDPTTSSPPVIVEGLADVVDVAVRDGIAYVAERERGLVIVDVHDPAHSQTLARMPGFHRQESLTLAWPIVWLVGSGGVQAYDVSTPAATRTMGGAGFGGALAMTVVGGLAAVALGDAGLAMLDVRDVSGSSPYSERSAEPDLSALTAADDLTYAALGAAGLTVYRTTPGRPPEVVGSYRDGPVYDLATAGDIGYAAAGNTGLHVLSLADPAHPQRLAVAPDFADARRVLSAGERVFVIEAHGAGISIFDVADPLVPHLIDSIAIDAQAFALLDAVDMLLVVTTDGRLMSVDIGQPGPAFRLQVVGWPHRARDVVASGTIAWLLVGEESVRTLDFATANAPSPRGVLLTPPGTQRLGLAGGQLVTAGRGCEAHKVDIADADRPVIVAHAAKSADCPDDPDVTGVLPVGSGVLLAQPRSGLWYAGLPGPGPVFLPIVHRNEGSP